MNSQINGTYHIVYKYPTNYNDRDRGVIQCNIKYFEGVCENFLPTGKCVFRNDEDVMLVVDYSDIVQIHPILNN